MWKRIGNLGDLILVADGGVLESKPCNTSGQLYTHTHTQVKIHSGVTLRVSL